MRTNRLYHFAYSFILTFALIILTLTSNYTNSKASASTPRNRVNMRAQSTRISSNIDISGRWGIMMSQMPLAVHGALTAAFESHSIAQMNRKTTNPTQELHTLIAIERSQRLTQFVQTITEQQHADQVAYKLFSDAEAQLAFAAAEARIANSSQSGSTGGVWASLRQCESGDNYADNTGNGYYGAYQFSLTTWESLGYSGLPSQAAPAVQDQAAQRLQALRGWGQWPACSAMLGL